MFLSKFTWQAYQRFLAAPVAEVSQFNGLDPAGQRLAMACRLRDQIQYFGKREDALPEWREASRITDPLELWKIWPSLPIITKAALNAHFEPVEMQRRFGLKGRLNSTGGSTGEPTRFFLDNAMLRVSRGSHLYSQLRMGWSPGMPTIIVWGSDRDIGKQTGFFRQVAQNLYGHHMVPGFAVDDAAVREVKRLILANSPVAIYGYSSLLERVADRTLALGLQAEPGRVKVAWNGAEMLYPHQVELFKRAFGVPILNRYGGRELSATAFQAEEGGPLLVIRPWLFVEIVNDAGQPVQPGEVGRLLLTSTVSHGTPFLRYDIGDLGACGETDYDESGIRSIGTLHGRSAGSLRLNNGRVVSSLYWNHLLKDYPEIRQFQVRVGPDGHLTILYVGVEFTGDRARHLLGVVSLLLGDQPVGLRKVEEIPRTPQGKLMQVIQDQGVRQ